MRSDRDIQRPPRRAVARLDDNTPTTGDTPAADAPAAAPTIVDARVVVTRREPSDAGAAPGGAYRDRRDERRDPRAPRDERAARPERRDDRRPARGADPREAGRRDGGPREERPWGERPRHPAEADRRGFPDRRDGPDAGRRYGAEERPFGGREGWGRSDGLDRHPRDRYAMQRDPQRSPPGRDAFAPTRRDGPDHRDDRRGGPRPPATPWQRDDAGARPFRDRDARPPRDAREERPNGPYTGRPERGDAYRPESAPRRPTPAPANAQAPTPTAVPPEGIRLSKLMAERGLASRREADEWIEAGWVKVNGHMAVLGERVQPEVQIQIDPLARQQQAQRVTVLLNKPIGYVSGQAEDGYEPASVLITPDNHWEEDPSRKTFHPGQTRGLAPAGRLDIDSTGLLVLTQDGRVAKHLIGDESEVEKEYLVRVIFQHEGAFPEESLRLLNHGLELDGHRLRPAKVSWANEDQLRFVLREGRKRQIRRMCEMVGLKVVGLKRVRIGSVVLGKLPPGQWRYLREDERF